MDKNLKRALIGLQIISFMPFFFGSFIFIVSFIEDIKILRNLKDYKPEIFIVTDQLQIIQSDENSTYTIVPGRINNYNTHLDLYRIKWYNKNYQTKIGDSIYVWFRNIQPYTLIRNKQELKLDIGKYLHWWMRELMIFGIPPFLIITLIYRQMKKNDDRTRY